MTQKWDGGEGVQVTRARAESINVSVVLFYEGNMLGKVKSGYINIEGTMYQLKILYPDRS